MSTTRICKICGEEKPINKFSNDRNRKSPRCNICRNAAVRARDKMNRQALAKEAVAVLMEHGPLTAHEMGVYMERSMSCVARALNLEAADKVVRKERKNKSAIYFILGDTREHNSVDPFSSKNPWRGIDDEHREWMQNAIAQRKAREERMARMRT